MKVAVSALLVVAEDDCRIVLRFWAGGDLVEEALGAGEVVGSGIEVAPEERGGP